MWPRIQTTLLLGGIILLCLAPACRNANEQPGAAPAGSTPSGSASSGGTVSEDGVSEDGAAASANSARPGATSESSPVVAEEEPTPPPTVLTVLLDATNQAICLVKVGDVFPEGTLVDAKGNPVETKSFLGKNLAVVYFWTAENPYAVAGLEDIGTLVPKELTEMGAVRVITVNEGNTPESAAGLISKTDSHVMNLFDPKGALLAKVATEKQLPRTYLVDSSGKIVWFDIEYSSSMKRNLRQALDVALSTKSAPK